MTHSVTLLITTNHQTIDGLRTSHASKKKSYSSIQNGEFCYGSVKSFRVARAAQGAPVRQHNHHLLLLLPRLLLPPQFMQVEKTDYRHLQVWKLEKGELKPTCTNIIFKMVPPFLVHSYFAPEEESQYCSHYCAVFFNSKLSKSISFNDD